MRPEVFPYTVTVTNSAGSSTSIPANLVVDSGLPPPAGVGAIHAAALYEPGTTVTILNSLTLGSPPSALGWSATIPEGWSYAGGSGEPDIKPTLGATGLIEWAWTAAPTSPVVFSYRLNVPVAESASRVLSAHALLRHTGSEERITVSPASLLLASARRFHTADADRNSRLELSELLRVIQLYNTRAGSVRTGRYREALGTEDGYAPDPTGAATLPSQFHAADLDRDGAIGLSDLTRVIELYNTRSGTARTGAYQPSAGTADGFAGAP